MQFLVEKDKRIENLVEENITLKIMIEDSNNTLNAIIKRLENGNKELENKIVFIIIK